LRGSEERWDQAWKQLSQPSIKTTDGRLIPKDAAPNIRHEGPLPPQASEDAMKKGSLPTASSAKKFFQQMFLKKALTSSAPSGGYDARASTADANAMRTSGTSTSGEGHLPAKRFPDPEVKWSGSGSAPNGTGVPSGTADAHAASRELSGQSAGFQRGLESLQPEVLHIEEACPKPVVSMMRFLYRDL
jgi:hypothetical protein